MDFKAGKKGEGIDDVKFFYHDEDDDDDDIGASLKSFANIGKDTTLVLIDIPKQLVSLIYWWKLGCAFLLGHIMTV